MPKFTPNLADQLAEAQTFAMSIRPEVGGFPVLAEALRQRGVRVNRWSLPSCQSIYLLNEGAVVQQGQPLVAAGTHEISKFDSEALVKAIRADQEGRTTFTDFLKATWAAGVVSYEADFVARHVTYFGANGETYRETYPAVDL